MPQESFDNVNSPDRGIREEHGYLNRDGRHLFYARFSPAGGSSIGAILCSPFGEEKVRTARVFVSFARLLASRGIEALCFDYFGDGDSEGNFEDAGFEDRLLDTEFAAKFLTKEIDAKKTGVIGLRWGATLAALAADRINPDLLILWEPIIDSSKYFYDYLRLNVASQMLADREVKKSRNDLVSDLEAGGNVLIEGYIYTSDFFLQGRKYDLRKIGLTCDCPKLLVQIDRNTSRMKPLIQEVSASLKNAETIAVGKEFEWEKTEQWTPAPPQLFNSTLSFMEKHGFFGKNI